MSDDYGETLVVYGLDSNSILRATAGKPAASDYSDHRMAMSLAIAGTSSRFGAVIPHPACVAKSYPDFFEQLVRLGGVFIKEE